MIDFTGLFPPILVFASVISGVAVTDLQSLYIDTITVPDSMQQRGYTPLVFIRMMNDELLRTEAIAKTRADAQKLRTQHEKGLVSVTLDMLNMTALVRAVQESSNLIEFTVNGEIVEAGPDYRLRLRIERYGSKVTRVEVEKPRNAVEALAAEAAEQIMKITDPQVFCAAVMQAEARNLHPSQGVFHFPETDACVRATLPMAQDDDRLWLLNLQGVIAFVEGRTDEAARHFRAAIRGNPDFSPALLNLGILQARNGRPAKAITYFKQIFNREIPTDSPQIFAAAYTEWADALVDVGQPLEAEAMFRRATEVDPKYAEVYYRWAKHSRDPQEAERLLAIGKTVAEQFGGVYTENLVGKLRMAAAEQPSGQSADDLEGNLGDIGVFAEPGRNRNVWDYLRKVWQRL